MSVCLSGRISPEPQVRSLPIFVHVPTSVARSCSGMLTIGRVAYRREGGDGSAQRGRSAIYDCLVFDCACTVLIHRLHFASVVHSRHPQPKTEFNFFSAASKTPLHFAANDVVEIVQQYSLRNADSAYMFTVYSYSVLDKNIPMTAGSSGCTRTHVLFCCLRCFFPVSAVSDTASTDL